MHCKVEPVKPPAIVDGLHSIHTLEATATQDRSTNQSYQNLHIESIGKSIINCRSMCVNSWTFTQRYAPNQIKKTCVIGDVSADLPKSSILPINDEPIRSCCNLIIVKELFGAMLWLKVGRKSSSQKPESSQQFMQERIWQKSGNRLLALLWLGAVAENFSIPLPRHHNHHSHIAILDEGHNVNNYIVAFLTIILTF